MELLRAASCGVILYGYWLGSRQKSKARRIPIWKLVNQQVENGANPQAKERNLGSTNLHSTVPRGCHCSSRKGNWKLSFIYPVWQRERTVALEGWGKRHRNWIWSYWVVYPKHPTDWCFIWGFQFNIGRRRDRRQIVFGTVLSQWVGDTGKTPHES